MQATERYHYDASPDRSQYQIALKRLPSHVDSLTVQIVESQAMLARYSDQGAGLCLRKLAPNFVEVFAGIERQLGSVQTSFEDNQSDCGVR
jgi:hypothetical protein